MPSLPAAAWYRGFDSIPLAPGKPDPLAPYRGKRRRNAVDKAARELEARVARGARPRTIKRAKRRLYKRVRAEQGRQVRSGEIEV